MPMSQPNPGQLKVLVDLAHAEAGGTASINRFDAETCRDMGWVRTGHGGYDLTPTGRVLARSIP
jgi:hypothetical protein